MSIQQLGSTNSKQSATQVALLRLEGTGSHELNYPVRCTVGSEIILERESFSNSSKLQISVDKEILDQALDYRHQLSRGLRKYFYSESVVFFSKKINSQNTTAVLIFEKHIMHPRLVASQFRLLSKFNLIGVEGHAPEVSWSSSESKFTHLFEDPSIRAGLSKDKNAGGLHKLWRRYNLPVMAAAICMSEVDEKGLAEIVSQLSDQINALPNRQIDTIWASSFVLGKITLSGAELYSSSFDLNGNKVYGAKLLKSAVLASETGLDLSKKHKLLYLETGNSFPLRLKSYVTAEAITFIGIFSFPLSHFQIFREISSLALILIVLSAVDTIAYRLFRDLPRIRKIFSFIGTGALKEGRDQNMAKNINEAFSTNDNPNGAFVMGVGHAYGVVKEMQKLGWEKFDPFLDYQGK